MQKKHQKSFWKEKSLTELSQEEWESLCDGCARCCMLKLEDIDTKEIAYTNIACKLLNTKTCKCKDYQNRQRRIPDCIGLNAQNIKNLNWMPSTCAYRLIAEGKELPWWHPLVSGRSDTVHIAGISVRGRTILENDTLNPDKHFIDWIR